MIIISSMHLLILGPSTTYLQTTTTLSTTSTAVPTTTVPPEVQSARLPLDLIPIHYDVDIKADIYTGNPKNFSKSGHVRIHFECKNATDMITLHISGLTVTDGTIKLFMADGVTPGPGIGNHTIDSRRQFLLISLTSPMTSGMTYVVEMMYTGPLTRNLFGMYYSSFQRDGKDMWVAKKKIYEKAYWKMLQRNQIEILKSGYNE